MKKKQCVSYATKQNKNAIALVGAKNGRLLSGSAMEVKARKRRKKGEEALPKTYRKVGNIYINPTNFYGHLYRAHSIGSRLDLQKEIKAQLRTNRSDPRGGTIDARERRKPASLPLQKLPRSALYACKKPI